MPDKVTCEIYSGINEEGNWIITGEESSALADLAEFQGGYHAKVVKLTVKIATNVHDDAGETLRLEVSAVQPP
jgi:hypothetical protein